MSLPKTFTTMIATRVAETEVFARKADTGERPPGERSKSPNDGPPKKAKKDPPKGGAPKDPKKGSSKGGGAKTRQQGTRGPKAGAGQGMPQGRPPGAKPPAAKANTGIAGGVVGVLLIALFIVFVTQNDGPGDAGGRSASSSSSATPSTTRTTGLTGGTTSRPTPTPNRTYEAFDDISVNDCLDAYKDPYDSSEWSENIPTAVSCGRSDAYVKVTGIRDSSSECDAEPLDGESWWRSPTFDGDNIYLCLRRQFREGECFLGVRGSKKGKIAINGHGMMTSWSCSKSTVPRDFDYILQFTGYYKSSCPDGSRKWSGFRLGVFCARVV